jgi:drug/metabolite transporter (DMT)-like permease
MHRTQSKTPAALWMAGWLALMLIIAVAGREAAREINVFQLLEMRSILGFLMLYPLIRAKGGFGAMRTKRLPQHIARNLIHYGAQFGWFFALTLIPIGQVVAIEFTMPIWTAILAATFLGEHMTIWKIAAIVLGIVGVVVIVRPATSDVNPGQLIALAAAVGFGVSVAMVKSLTRTEQALSISFWMLVVQSAAGLLPALYVWTWPPTYLWGWVVVIAFCGTLPLLHGARDAACRRHRGDPDGLPAGSPDRRCRLADLFGTAGSLHRARRHVDPHRQSVEPETESFD